MPREVAEIAEAERRRLAEIKKQQNAHRQLEEQKAARIRRKQQANETIAVLREKFPKAFTSPPVPLAVGIHRELREATRAEIPAQRLSAAMGFWTDRHGYLERLAAAEPRRNLDGSIAGPPDPEHVQKARKILKERTERRRKRAPSAAKRELRPPPSSFQADRPNPGEVLS